MDDPDEQKKSEQREGGLNAEQSGQPLARQAQSCNSSNVGSPLRPFSPVSCTVGQAGTRRIARPDCFITTDWKVAQRVKGNIWDDPNGKKRPATYGLHSSSRFGLLASSDFAEGAVRDIVVDHCVPVSDTKGPMSLITLLNPLLNNGSVNERSTEPVLPVNEVLQEGKRRLFNDRATWIPGQDTLQAKEGGQRVYSAKSLSSPSGSGNFDGPQESSIPYLSPLEAARQAYARSVMQSKGTAHIPPANENEKIAEQNLGMLFAGARFLGEQKNGRDKYEVQVDIQQVNTGQSQLCGYLKIKELTDDHPNLCTFFEAEIIGPHYSFVTDKWNADEFIDLQHWSKFPAFKPYLKSFNDPNYKYQFHSSDYLFMRWKEHFLVPDHNIRSIAGASFAGFYYICYHRKENIITGYYYHQNSEWFQQLTLRNISKNAFSSFAFH